MKLPDAWLSSVFFLGIEGDAGPPFRGTGFYFQVVNEFDPTLERLYFVTARHNIEGAHEAPGALFVRVNTEDQGSIHLPVSKDGWTFHHDSSVDVAVVSVNFAKNAERSLESTRLSEESCVTDSRIREFEIGAGSDISVIGLFTYREGFERNLPIVRSGTLAAMSGELIEDGTPHGPYRAYLAEIMSIGGLSGSPVFVHPLGGPHHKHPTERLGDGRMRTWTEWNQPSFVLGMVRSHWDERPPGSDRELPRPEWLNRGIAAVTPIGDVLEVLGYEEFRDERMRDAEAAARRSLES